MTNNSQTDRTPKTILVAPLNWGLGHATRCIPIIRALLKENFKVIIASDGEALLYLKKEFPELSFISLPSYDVSYPKTGILFKWKMIFSLFKFRKAIRAERKCIKDYIKRNKINGIISDNRLGIRNNQIPSVYLTHQLYVPTGFTSGLSSKLHRHFIKKFDECWIPDDSDAENNLSGKLSHPKSRIKIPLRFTGPLTRIKKTEVFEDIEMLAVLSGPEPQRSILEKKLITEFQKGKKDIILVRGKMEKEQISIKKGNLIIFNYMLEKELEDYLNRAKIVISRSGYSSIMDLAVLEKKVFFIPTPGQYEQLYLAKRMKHLKMAPFCSQKDFTLDKIEEIKEYSGVQLKRNRENLSGFFSLFQ